MRCPICNKILMKSRHGVHSHLRIHKLSKEKIKEILVNIFGDLFEKKQKYNIIKAKIRDGVLVSREDFLFVKSIDQKGNAQTALNSDRPRFRDNVYRHTPKN